MDCLISHKFSNCKDNGGIIVVVATKNRVELLERSLISITKQTKKYLEAIVVSDSNSEIDIEKERQLCKKYNFTYLTDKYSHNYAGNLNTAIEAIFVKYIYDLSYDPKKLFIAFLDDDDFWHDNYLSECWNSVDEKSDVVVCGLNYHSDDKSFPLSIPDSLDINSFLKGNPHIQGSNTFVRLSILLEAGCFDENLNSTTDRDLFTRIFMLKPDVRIVTKYLVEVDASDSRERLTNRKEQKKVSLAKFYYKYKGVMNDKVKQSFFERVNHFCEIDNELDLLKTIKSNHSNDVTPSLESIKLDKYPKLCISFITTDVKYAERMINEICNLDYEDKKIIIFTNFESSNNLIYLKELLNKSNIQYDLLTLCQARDLVKNNHFDKFVEDNIPTSGFINSISTARSILQYFIYQHTNDGDVIYVVDEDMEFSSIIRHGGEYKIVRADVKGFVAKYINNYDAVVGSYSMDAPIPSLSTLRVNLLDYVFTKKLGKDFTSQDNLFLQDDYYYSFSDNGNLAIETPFPLIVDCSIEEVLSGKAISRPLVTLNTGDFEARRRGGNTLIFNRQLLLIPNLSVKIGPFVARRGDSLWTFYAKEKGYKIIGSTFALNQNRLIYSFDLSKELDKEISDILGYSMISTIEKRITESRTAFSNEFCKNAKNRTVKFAISYFRVIGLLKILDDKNLVYLQNPEIIYNFIRRVKEVLDISNVNAAFDELRNYITLNENRSNLEKIKKFLIEQTDCNDIDFVDYGNEGAIFNTDKTTYKVFFDKSKLEFFKSIVPTLNNFEEFPRNIYFYDSQEYAYCSYDRIYDFEKYNGGYAKELAKFIDKLRLHGLVINNFKKENILISKGKFIYVDLGRDIIPYSESNYEKSVERCYQMINFSNLSSHDFRILISRSYIDSYKAFNYSLPVFKDLIKGRTKEEIHDPMVINLIEKHHPSSLLDYGSGKCKIANHFSNKVHCSVFDIDFETIIKRANDNVEIIKDIEACDKQFDLIDCNKVLCCVDDDICTHILKQIRRLLKDEGTLILSICNPFFDDIDKTETNIRNYKGNYEDNAQYVKTTIYGNRTEYHRTFNFYERILAKFGFKIENIYEDNAIDTENLSYVGDHLFFECKKINKEELKDCSLLIKANPMDAKVLYESVKHIVSQLEINENFYEILLCCDDISATRIRRFANDNLDLFNKEVIRLKNDGYIDRVISLELPNDFAIFDKYFNKHSECSHALNGQNLLATLKGFESVKTRYVLQTDLDIIYFNDGKERLFNALDKLKNSKAITLSLSIAHKDLHREIFNCRTECRTCFVDLNRLNKVLPLNNEIENEVIKFPWHRSLDNLKYEEKSIRLHSNHLYFIHPENKLKNINCIGVVTSQVEKCFVPREQIAEVNLQFVSSWYPKTSKETVVFIRGRNTTPSKLKRLFLSINEQNYDYFQIVYFDDNSSSKASVGYVEYIYKYSPYFRNKLIFIKNDIRVGSAANFECFFKNICLNPNAIIINLDSDDALLTSDALSVIKDKFDKGADVTVGNCFRVDKPLKKYKVTEFKNSWERDGDNIWLHPKCFKRYLCEFIQDNLKKDGNYIEVCTDYAMMLPIIQNAKNPIFIERPIYLFDTSDDNKKKIGVYKDNSQSSMKDFLLKRAEKMSEHKTVAVIGDGSISSDSEEYNIAFNLGKRLIDEGYKIQNGGLGGVMEAAFKGAKSSPNYFEGSTIGLVPSSNYGDANIYADVVIPTGLDILRNGLVVDADAVIVVGGGVGTLSEMAMAWQKYKLIIAFTSIEGVGAKFASTKLDKRIRYQNIPEDCIYPASNVEEAIELLKKNIGRYNKKYKGIKWRNKR